MSNSYYANTAWVVTEDGLKKIAPDAWEKFLNVLDEVSVAEFCQYCETEQGLCVSDARIEEIDAAWNNFSDAFYEKTCNGLSVIPCYHDQSNDGDRADHVDGAFFEIDGMECLTPAGVKYQDIVEKAYWVTYG